MGLFQRTPGSARPSILHWHEPGTSKEEKWLIRKLDIFILTYSCLVSVPPSLLPSAC